MTEPTADLYRVVIRGTAPDAGVVASSPMGRAAVDAGYPNVAEAFADDVARGEAVLEIYTEANYQAQWGGSDDG